MGLKRLESTVVALLAGIVVVVGCFAFLVLGSPGTSSEEKEVESAPDFIEISDVEAPVSPTVMVLNGCGVEGLAESCARDIENMGYDLVSYGDSVSLQHDSSKVLYASQEFELDARAIASVFGVDSDNVLLGSGWAMEDRESGEMRDYTVLFIAGSDCVREGV